MVAGTRLIVTLHARCLVYVTKVSLKKKKDVEPVTSSGVPSGGLGVQPPPPEIPKALQNRAKLNLNVKTVKNCLI